MRILFNSQEKIHKEPFGCLTPGQLCRLQIHIPSTVKASAVSICFNWENGSPFREVPMTASGTVGAYDIWQGSFSLEAPDLYFYYFRITGHTGTFRLFKQGKDTNMEAGDLWQLSCVPADFTVPDWAQGANIYQIFPDRFYKSGDTDLTGKLQPYLLHSQWDEEVVWQPNEKGEVLNNDFYGGNFRGITDKMDYIASLGTTLLYLNPISKSFSSHRYDTADYKSPDPMLGTEEDFSMLCEAAHSRGIRVILDGVFSHTGADSLYFNKYGSFGTSGAFRDPDSPYRSWYTFRQYPNDYISWWNFDTLPTVNKLDPSFIEYVITGEDSVLAHWLKLGADGFRMDVADELPGEFLALFKKQLRQLKPDALLMGEVWEDASNKIAYGKRCRYFTDGVLDSIMNYPFRKAILDFLWGRDDGSGFEQRVMGILENYPAQVVNANMNLLGTHDTPRILTTLVDEFDGSREALAKRTLSPEDRKRAESLLLTASVLQFTLPGSPSIYYGDEAGMEGGKDPFNRRTYPWGQENTTLLAHHRTLGQLRRHYPALAKGTLRFFCAQNHRLGYRKTLNGQTVRIYVNQSDTPWEILTSQILAGVGLSAPAPDRLILEPKGYCITEDRKWNGKL